MLKKYLKELLYVAQQGDAREESYYSVLYTMFQTYADEHCKKKIHITTLPKATEAGNPDFRVWDGKQHIVGYIEAKSLTIPNLDHVEISDQLKRYRHTFPNLILTNFCEFRLYRNGVLIDSVQIARPYIIYKLGTIPPVEKEGDFYSLMEKYFSFSLPKVYDAKTLAVELAKRTRFLRDEVIAEEIREEEEGKQGAILGFYETFHNYLIYGLSKSDFADLYSQTITYGLFAARTRTENGFNRKLAYDKIPHTIGILREMFEFISLGDPPQSMEWMIDDISEVLEVTDINKILHDFFHKGKGKDPIVHFYETFLAEYDPKTREKRGVYYTPEPVVSYIVRSINHLLQEKFSRADGLASENVTLLDPAAGTLTFLSEAAKVTVEEFVSKYGEGGRSNFIKNHILRNFFAFELMMAPYTVGHLKITLLLEELGYKLTEDDRFQLYLTNTLEMEELEQSTLPFAISLSEESKQAGEVKKKQPILIIIGNPPYSGHSANVSQKVITVSENGKDRRKRVKTWIGEQIDNYKIVDGKPLGERNPKWLQDDYVKFIRFAQWKIDQNGEGVLGFITNHSYLDNPTFRGMRQSLMNTFDEMYLLDLHGNAKKKEVCPDGSKDKNVFDIQQGVAIALFIKRHMNLQGCIVKHADLWGLRQSKYKWLESHDVSNTKWQELTPKSEFYLFIPRDIALEKDYNQFVKITDIFPVNSVGVVTSRDKFVIDFEEASLKRRIRMFRDDKLPDEIIQQTFDLKDKVNWKLADVRNKVRKDKNWERSFTTIHYRPFDVRNIFYHDSVIERSRKEVMWHMLQENIGIVTSRQTQTDFRHIFVTEKIIEFNLTGIAGRYGSGYLFPLYLYRERDNPGKHSYVSTMMIFEPSAAEYDIRKPNINADILRAIKNLQGFHNLEGSDTPVTIFYYIYAVLYSPTYRNKYKGFLKIDFPRVPFTKDINLFLKLARLGKRLVDLHLLKSNELSTPISKFQGQGDGRVETPFYKSEKCKVFINSSQYFENVTPKIWDYQVGGYQVCHKWLKDRKGRILTVKEIRTYCRIVTALRKTIEIQKEIDSIYAAIEKDLLLIELK